VTDASKPREHPGGIRLHLTGPVRGVVRPVSAGVPFPSGRYTTPERLGLLDGAGRPVPVQWHVLARWPDRSARWALLDFLVRASEGHGDDFMLVELPDGVTTPDAPVLLRQDGTLVSLDTTLARFEVSSGLPAMTARLSGPMGGPTVDVTPVLEDSTGRQHLPRLGRATVEATGPVRATLHLAGAFAIGRGRTLELETRLSVFAGTGLALLELTLRNPAAAIHRGGLWDLGDAGSVLFRAFTVRARVAGAAGSHVEWTAEPRGRLERHPGGPVEIYQDSSGGANWQSRNHVNRDGRVPLAFRGYRVHGAGDAPHGEGLRASPVMTLATPGLRVSGTVERFWQNFPKALEAHSDDLLVHLFPARCADTFELLGGEQKTHRVWLELAPPVDDSGSDALGWVHEPSRLVIDPAWYATAGVVPAIPPEARETGPHEGLLREALRGANSFFHKRETIDEYGWRHFGDVNADHENLHYSGQGPVVSHYNNQYDLLLGFLTQYLRTGEPLWLELGEDLARHVVDIDIYHTRRDRPSYNGGLFWHTDHYQDAGRAGHRTYSKDSPRARSGRPYGGGPSNEHNYTSGLLLYHYLTGSVAARDAVLTLARWVLDMDDGRKSVLGALDPAPTGQASSTYSVHYHGPGRGAGNSINAVLDALALTGDSLFLAKAEELIRRCIHPRDDIAARELHDLERRWSYVVFLQALGKYLDVKSERGELDHAWLYARESLLHYARWMLAHEAPNLTALDRVEYPTETWPAHDLRKSWVFGTAARHAGPGERGAFLAAAESYFAEAFRGLGRFETRTCTRPLAIVLQNAITPAEWRGMAPAPGSPAAVPSFGDPVPFVPQLDRVRRLLRSPRGWLTAAARLVRPDRVLDLVRLSAAEARRRLS
jgi:hypothetical protein